MRGGPWDAVESAIPRFAGPTHQAGAVACPTKDRQSFIDVDALRA